MVIPTIIGQLIVLIYNLADTFFVGRANNPFMTAGLSLILPVFNITFSIASLTGVGGGSYISRLLGQGNTDEAKKVSSFCIYVGILTTAIFSVLTAVFADPLLRLLGAGDNTFLYAKQYLFCVIVFGGIPTVLANIFSNLLRSTGESGKAGFGVAMGGVINIILDPIFMFVILPRGNEALGAGIATCLSNIICCVYYFIVIFRLRHNTVISFRFTMPEKKSIGSIFSVGIPAAVATLLFDLDYIVIDKLMASYNDISLAAVGIVLKAERLPLNVGAGLSQGMMPIVAYNFSAKNYHRMKDTISYTRKIGIITGAVSIILYELFAPYIINFFINNKETIALGADFLRVRCLATPFMFLSFFTMNLFQSFGKGNTALFLGCMRWIALNIPMLFILNHFFGLYGIVWSQVTADIINVTISFIIFFRYQKKLMAQIDSVGGAGLGSNSLL